MADQLIPVVVNESAAFRATALRQEGYVQAGDPIQCPLCGLRFVLLLDPKDHPDSDGAAITHKEKATVFFQEIIMQDHINDHPHWQFRMTAVSLPNGALARNSDELRLQRSPEAVKCSPKGETV